jgi:hypothetical protein
MSETRLSNGLPDMRPIDRLIRRTRRLLRSSWVATGTALAAGLLLASLVLTTLLDLAWPLSTLLRTLALACVVLPTCWAVATRVLVPLFRRLRAAQVARRIENQLPGIQNRLVSCIDLKSGRTGAPSPAFFHRLVREAVERIREFRPWSVVDVLKLRRAGAFAGLATAAFVLAWVLFSDRLPIALARIFHPLEDIPPASSVAYTVSPGDARALRGEDILLAAHVTRGTPDRLRVELRGDGTGTLWFDLGKQSDDTWQLLLNTTHIAPGFEHGFTYRVHGGGTWSPRYQIVLFDRPSLAELHTVLHYPEYMGMPEPRIGPPQVADVTGPEESTVEVVARVEGNVSQGEIQFLVPKPGPAKGVGGERWTLANVLPMQPTAEGVWSGRFPLRGKGFYRIELSNELGHRSKPMKEGRFEAIPDRPPQVVLERPGSDLVLGEPARVPLIVSASDDFGLQDVSLLVRQENGGIVGRPLRRYERPVRSDTVLGTLDLPALGLKPGGELRYRVEARDRKGQIAQTPEFVVRISTDKNGVDRQVAEWERAQDSFGNKLMQLIAEQAKVREAITKLDARYAPLTEKLRGAAADKPAEQGKPTPPLDPDTAKLLQALRQELADTAGREEQNAQRSQEIANDLKNAAEQAERLPLVPAPVAAEAKALEQLFQERGVQPLRDLAGRLQEGKDAQKPAPNLPDLRQRSERVQKELVALKQRLDALATAEKQAHQDAEGALARLKDDMLRQDAGLTARELEALRDFIQKLRGDLKRLEGGQQELLEANRTARDLLRPELVRQQTKLEKEAVPTLKDARDLHDAKEMRKLRNARNDPSQDGGSESAEGASRADSGDAPSRPEPRPGVEGTPPADRDQLGQRQEQNLEELSKTEAGLGSDAQSVEQLLDRLRQTTGSAEPPSHGGEHVDMSPELARLLRSEAFQQALAMVARMRQLAQAPAAAGQGQPLAASQAVIGNLQGGLRTAVPPEIELGRLDPETRAALLRMQPKQREEILQGMQEEGPEGYRAFIRDYFQRLSRSKDGK